jgi:acyl-CoA thioesterase-1
MPVVLLSKYSLRMPYFNGYLIALLNHVKSSFSLLGWALLTALTIGTHSAAAVTSSQAVDARHSTAKLPARSSVLPAESGVQRILIVGDSISAEYGLRRGSGWVSLLIQRLAAQKIPATVVNASISGDTTSGGRARLPSLIRRHAPTILVIELGANDALRGLPLNSTRANLDAMIQLGQSINAKVLLLGMQVPPNYGARYTADFAKVFVEASQKYGTALVPFFLTGVADGPQAERFFQSDRIHPNELAQPIMLDNAWPSLMRLMSP